MEIGHTDGMGDGERDATRAFLSTHREPGAEFAGPSVVGLQEGCYPLVGWFWRQLRALVRWSWAQLRR